MPYFRVTFEGYIEGEYDSAEDAKQELIDQIENNELDGYGREWSDLIHVEEFDEESGEWH